MATSDGVQFIQETQSIEEFFSAAEELETILQVREQEQEAIRRFLINKTKEEIHELARQNELMLSEEIKNAEKQIEQKQREIQQLQTQLHSGCTKEEKEHLLKQIQLKTTEFSHLQQIKRTMEARIVTFESVISLLMPVSCISDEIRPPLDLLFQQEAQLKTETEEFKKKLQDVKSAQGVSVVNNTLREQEQEDIIRSCEPIEKLFVDLENVVKAAKKETQRQQVSINQKMHELLEERKTLQDKMKQMTSNNEQLQLKNRKLQNKKKILRTYIGSQRRVIRSYEDKWSKMGDTNTIFDKQLKKRYEENSSLMEKNKKLTEENIGYSIQLKELKALRTAQDQLKQKLTKLEIDNERLSQNLCQEKADKDEALSRLCTLEKNKTNETSQNVDHLHHLKPINISAKMTELYENEWFDAFKSLEKKYPDKDGQSKIAKELLHILKNINQLCNEMDWHDCLQQAQTATGGLASAKQEFNPPACSDYKVVLIKEMQEQMKEFKTRRALTLLTTLQRASIPNDVESNMRPYYDKCVEVCWLAAVHEPPLFMHFNTGEEFDKDLFGYYITRGPYVAFLNSCIVFSAESGNENLNGPILVNHMKSQGAVYQYAATTNAMN